MVTYGAVARRVLVWIPLVSHCRYFAISSPLSQLQVLGDSSEGVACPSLTHQECHLSRQVQLSTFTCQVLLPVHRHTCLLLVVVPG